MSLTARDLYFVLRVRDEASSVLTGVSRDILKIGAAAQASSARAQAAALRQQAANVRASGAARAEALRAAEAATREHAARLRASGATRSQVLALDAQARAYSREASAITSSTDKQVKALQKQAQSFDIEAKKLDESVRNHQRLSRTLSDVSSAITIGGLVMVGAGVMGVAALLSMVKAGIEYDRQVALTMTQTDGFKTSLEELGQVGKDIGSKIAAPFGELQEALYDIFSSTSANVAEAKVLLASFAKAAVAGQVSIDDAARSTMGIMNAFKIPFKDVNVVLDKQFQLVRKGVGTYAEFSKVIGKLTPSAVRLNQGLDTMDATLIFLTRNGLNTSSAVAAAARAFDALANPKTTAKLDDLGIKSRDAHGKFLPLVDILKNMKKYLLDLPPPDRAKALFDIFKGSGGTIQAKRFFDLILPNAKGEGNLDQFEGFLKDMQGSTGQFTKAYNIMADTVAAKSQLLNNNWQIMKVTIGQALEPAFKKLLDIGNKILQWFNGLTPKQQEQIAKWALFAAALVAVVGVAVVIIGGLGALAAALAALGFSLGIVLAVVGGVVAAIALLIGVFVGLYKNSAPIRQLFSDIGKTFQDVWKNAIQPFFKGVGDAYFKYMKPALKDLWAVINKDVIPVLDDLWKKFGKQLVGVIKDVLDNLKNLIKDGFKVTADAIRKNLIPAIKEATDYYHTHRDTINKVITAIMFCIKWIGIISGSAAMGLLIAVVRTSIDAMAFWIKMISNTVHTISGLVTAIKNAWGWLKNLRQIVINAAAVFVSALVNKIKQAIEKIRNIGSAIKNAAGSMISTLFNAGANIVRGLINGISSKLGALYDKARSMAAAIRSTVSGVLGIFSPARAMVADGKNIVNGYIKGINDSMPRLIRQAKAMAGAVQANVSADISGSRTVPNKPQAPATKTVVVNVYTQEIRPEYHAQQLGHLMAATA